jgi:hypothetical protein
MENEYLNALKNERTEVVDKIRAFGDEVKTRSDKLATPEEDELLTACLNRADELKVEIDKVEAQLNRIASLADTPGAVENEDEKTRIETVNVNTRTDPFENLERIDRESSDDLRSRAETVIESHLPSEIPDEWREGMIRSASRGVTKSYDGDLVRQHIIASSSPEYVEAFQQYVETNGTIRSEILSNRAAMSLTAGNGGVMVPQFLDPTINLINSGTATDIRQISRNTQITSGTGSPPKARRPCGPPREPSSPTAPQRSSVPRSPHTKRPAFCSAPTR